MRGVRLFKVDEFNDLVESLNESLDREYGNVLLLEEPLPDQQAMVIDELHGVLCFAVRSKYWKQGKWPSYIQGFISDPNDPQEIDWVFEQASRIMELRYHRDQLKFKLVVEEERRHDLMESSLQLFSERNLRSLCETVLTRIRKLLSAEGASIYLADSSKSQLRFSHVQNEMVPTKWQEIKLPLDATSIVGACAVDREVINLPDAYHIPESASFSFNKSFDEKTGYRTKSILCIPLLKTNDELVGVVQLINSKRRDEFMEDDIELGKSLSNHIALALETALLYQDIEQLFESFIKASVTAIESRDPTTSGHSERVAILTVGLADRASASQQPPFKGIHYSPDQIKEIRYASLLHDFGKIGVPECVLVKQKKLYEHELGAIQARFQILKLAYPAKEAEFERIWRQILEANEPTVLVEELKSDLLPIVGHTYKVEGESLEILTAAEWERLSIKKGSLSAEERRQIESHVEHSYRFLERIHWTGSLARVPEIAGAHHEKLNGKGYPHGLKEEEIPFESQVMAVADIFDALTAMDRPYKRAVPIQKAIDILKLEAKDRALNSHLVQLFEEQKLWELLQRKA